ncbi:hypothetical protein A1O1_04091 [Capronia coronata CBS 617.96]|uniref:Enoyl reductase (ER) domain-containing protein n=1 Tax=Capronia coronata CBS 617.96 TaxID=1182541 RepID=W9Z902_9EURO|nr:uncharacterized protein A1O1_04091 [Capronia coronata CBS 617.96]EXJ90984.1 hypothetical protein A1O1_04091 [Capronia coronata CBS 617.96]
MAAMVLTNPSPLPTPPYSCFTYRSDYPRPTLPDPEWTLVRIHACGLNRAELRSRAGLPPGIPEFNIFQAEYHADPPAILGEEFVGEVELAGSRSGFEPGERVAGIVYGGGKAHDGSYAQYSICHSRRLFRLPKPKAATTTSSSSSSSSGHHLSWEVLAAIPMSMVTAYGCIVLAGGLERKRNLTSSPITVLVHGATSSVGIWAILLAKERGATVIATTRNASKAAHLQKCGADHVLLEDQLDHDLPRLVPNGVDIVLELVGPNQTMRSLGFAARYGTVVVAGVLNLEWDAGGFNPVMIPPTRNLSFYTLTNSGVGNEDDGIDQIEGLLADVIGKVESGVFPVDCFLDRTFRLDQMGEAHDYMERNKAMGKVVVSVP